MAKCWPRDLPPHLKGQVLRYRLVVVPRSLRGKRKVLPFQRPTVASDDAMTPQARALFAAMDKRDKALQALLKRIKRATLPEVVRCRCGAVLHDPSNPATIAEHAPHLPPLM
jgi:hypothetical protein